MAQWWSVRLGIEGSLVSLSKDTLVLVQSMKTEKRLDMTEKLLTGK